MSDLAFTDEPVTKRSLDRAAADRLREAVISGRFAPGSRVTETILAHQLGLSRGTIRSALHRLVSEGLIVQVPYTGWEVCKLTAQDAWELYTLRSSLEGLAARLAAERITKSGRSQLRAAFSDLVAAAGDDTALSLANADLGFHRTIVTLSGHQRLLQHYAMLGNQIRMYIASTNEMTGDRQLVVQVHEGIRDAIMSGQSDRAEELIREHNIHYGTLLVSILNKKVVDLVPDTSPFSALL